MACIYVLAKKGKCLWLPFIPIESQIVLYCSLHSCRVLLLFVHLNDNSWFRVNYSENRSTFCAFSVIAILIPGEAATLQSVKMHVGYIKTMGGISLLALTPMDEICYWHCSQGWAHNMQHAPFQTRCRTAINTNHYQYIQKSRLIFLLDAVTQHLYNGNLIAHWLMFTRK